MDTITAKKIALMQHQHCAFDSLVECFGDSTFAHDYIGWRVLTEDEAEAAFEKALDNILDDVILPNLDEALQCYFDRDAWKRDAQYDGRGHHLNYYDRKEYNEVVNGTSYYIYRVN